MTAVRFICLITLISLPVIVPYAQLPLDGYDRVPLRKVIEDLQSEFNVIFSFKDDNVDGDTITLEKGNYTLDAVLTEILNQTRLDFNFIDDQNVILTALDEEERWFEVCGRVLDSLSREPLPYASVYIPSTGQGTSTDSAGAFTLSVARKSGRITISYIGYKSSSIPLTRLSEKPCLNIGLSLDAQQLGTITLTEYLTDGIDQVEGGQAIRIDPNRLSVLPGSPEPDVMSSIQMLPGIFSADETASGLFIRGGTPDQNLILYDQIPMYHTGHFFGMISAFNPYIVDGIDVYRSGTGAEYGGRVSGVIDIQSKDHVPSKIEGGAGLNLTHGHGNLSVPLGNNAAIHASYRRSFTDFWATPTFNRYADRVFQGTKIEEDNLDGDIETSDEFYFNDYNIKGVWSPGKNRFGINLFESENNLDYTADIPEWQAFSNDLLNLQNEGLSAFWERDWSDRFTSNITLTQASYNYDYTLSYMPVQRPDRLLYAVSSVNKVTDDGFQWNNIWRVSDDQQLNFGYQHTDNNIDIEISSRGPVREEREENNFKNRLHTLYGSYNFKFQDIFNITVGLRYQHQDILKENYFEPRISFESTINEQLTLKFNSSKQFQFISQLIVFDINQIDLQNAVWIAADGEGIPVIESNQWMAGIIYTKNDWTIDLEGYVKELSGITSLSSSFSELPEQPYSQGNSRIRGIDVLVRKRIRNYKSWLSYTLSTALYEFPELSTSSFPATHDQRHALQWVHVYKAGPWQWSLGWQLRSGLPFTPPLDIEIFENPVNGESFPRIQYGDENSERLAAYHRLDATINYYFGRKSGFRGFAGLSFINIYDHRNIIGRSYFIEDEGASVDDYEIIEISEGGLRFTPNFVLRIEF